MELARWGPVTLLCVDSSYNIGDAATHLARAELLFDLNRFDEARDELGGALSNDPAHVPSLTLLALLEMLVENYDEALTAATAALAAEPTYEPAVLARGHALALSRNADQALTAAEDLQQRYPESWWHQVHYALIVSQARNGQDALDAAWVAVKLAPEEARAHLTLAVVAGYLGLEDLSQRAAAAAERLNPAVLSLLEGPVGPRMLRGRPDRPVSAGMQGMDSGVGDMERAPMSHTVRRILRQGAAVAVIPPLVVALIGGGTGYASVVAVLAAVVAAVIVAVLWRRLPEHDQEGVRVEARQDRVVMLAVGCVAAGPVLVALFGLLGNPALLAGSIAAGLVTLGISLLYRT